MTRVKDSMVSSVEYRILHKISFLSVSDHTVWLTLHLLAPSLIHTYFPFYSLSSPFPSLLPLLPSPPSPFFHLLPPPSSTSCRVFRTLFQEGQQAQSPLSRRFTSPMVRKRLPTTSCIISPQGSRKLSHSGAKPKLALNKRKKSTQELTRSASPDPPSFFFCEDPRNMNIKEQVCYY